jgi:hypothetical protein
MFLAIWFPWCILISISASFSLSSSSTTLFAAVSRSYYIRIYFSNLTYFWAFCLFLGSSFTCWSVYLLSYWYPLLTLLFLAIYSLSHSAPTVFFLDLWSLHKFDLMFTFSTETFSSTFPCPHWILLHVLPLLSPYHTCHIHMTVEISGFLFQLHGWLLWFKNICWNMTSLQLCCLVCSEWRKTPWPFTLLTLTLPIDSSAAFFMDFFIDICVSFTLSTLRK